MDGRNTLNHHDLPELTPRRNAPVCMAKKRVERAAAGSRRPVFIVLFCLQQILAYSDLFHVAYREFDIFIQEHVLVRDRKNQGIEKNGPILGFPPYFNESYLYLPVF